MLVRRLSKSSIDGNHPLIPLWTNEILCVSDYSIIWEAQTNEVQINYSYRFICSKKMNEVKLTISISMFLSLSFRLSGLLDCPFFIDFKVYDLNNNILKSHKKVRKSTLKTNRTISLENKNLSFLTYFNYIKKKTFFSL